MTLLVYLYLEHSDLIIFGNKRSELDNVKQYYNNLDTIDWCVLDEYLEVILKEYFFFKL